MLPYTGNGTYCYANSLHMALSTSGYSDLPDPGRLECLTTMPFGYNVFRFGDDVMFFPSNPEVDPDTGLTRALDALGWACDEAHGGPPDEAVERLRGALARGVVLAGPLDMGGLTYIPWRDDAAGSDHFVLVLGIEADGVRVHDPAGWPFAVIPLAAFVGAWQAEKVSYGRKLMMRSNFRPADPRPFQEASQRVLPSIRTGVKSGIDGPTQFGGVPGLSLVIAELRAGRDPGGLAHVPLPLGARRSLDGALFLRDLGLEEAARLMEQKAILYGKAQQPAVDQRWGEVADILEHMRDTEQRLIEAIG